MLQRLAVTLLGYFWELLVVQLMIWLLLTLFASDYAYLREHFREKHFLCEEGRCSTEQFTHAFRTEIDLKAHKTACHSRSRAEARQNRQIDLQFSFAPRHSRRSEGELGACRLSQA